jgi:hypothetical protein
MKGLILLLFFVLGSLPVAAYRDIEAGTFITRDPAGFVDGPNLYTYVKQNPWTLFDPEGLQSLDETRKEGVTYQTARSTQFKPGEAEAVLNEHGQKVMKPTEVSDDRVKELRGSGQFDGKTDEEVRVSESARANAINAKWALVKYEGTPATKKLFAAWSGMNDILLTTTMAVPGPGGGAVADSTAVATRTVTSDLKALTAQAVGKIDANGLNGLSDAQVAAVLANPKLYPMFRGTAIDSEVRAAVAADPVLSKLLTGQPNKGVDFTNVLSQQRYDMTTLKDFSAHVDKYGDQPSPIVHLDTTQK